VIKDIIKGDRDEGDGNDRDKKSFSLMRRSIPIISLVPCEEERVNQNLIRRKRASDLLRADEDSELKRRLTANKKEQVNDTGKDNKGRSDANCRQDKDEEVKKN
jgi:hypothetical protein